MGTIPHLRPPFPLFSSSIPRLRSVAAGSAFVLESAISAARCSNSPTPLYQLTFVRFYAKKKKMPPKKEVKQEKILLGRPGNNLKSGIVGLANVGKSTLLQAITKCSLGNPANFPYATIDPEEARVIVPDERYDWLNKQYKPKSEVPAHMTVYDIAGLTRGASTGAGLGNAFLSHIRAVDAIFQVVRCFDDAEIIHVEGDVDPVRDLDIISEELRIKDIEFTEKALENLSKQTRRGGQTLEMKKMKEEQATVEKVLEILKDGKDVRHQDWSPKEVETINPLFLLSAKPVVYLVNLSERDYIRQKNKHLPKIAEWTKSHAPGDPIIPISVSFEDRLTRFESQKEIDEEREKVEAKSQGKVMTKGKDYVVEDGDIILIKAGAAKG